jgi:hypothetical protein
MTGAQFAGCLKRLYFVDRANLERALGFKITDIAWQQFRDAPVAFMIHAEPITQEAIWVEIGGDTLRRKTDVPSSASNTELDSVDDLPPFDDELSPREVMSRLTKAMEKKIDDSFARPQRRNLK